MHIYAQTTLRKGNLMVSKVIMRNETDMTDDAAIIYVMGALREGRLAQNDHEYCVTDWDNGVTVSAKRNKSSNTFIVWQRTV